MIDGSWTNNVKVANGSLFGIGIYLSTDPRYCEMFCRSDGHWDVRRAMFVCATAEQNAHNPGHDMRVFNNPDDVLPLWLVHFDARRRPGVVCARVRV